MGEPAVKDIASELREDYPPVDVTAVVFSRDFAGTGCCVIPQGRALAMADTFDALVKALQLARKRIEYLGAACTNPRHFEANVATFLPAIDEVLTAALGSHGEGG